MNSSNPGLWLDVASSAAWADACKREISVWLRALAGAPETVTDLQVDVHAPTQHQAKAAFSENLDLHGAIACIWNGQTVKLKFPMPFHGVFLSHRSGFQRGLVSVWPSWLGETPGFRLMRPTSETRREHIQWRIGLPGGRYLTATLNKMTAAENRKLEAVPYFGSQAAYPDWLAEHLVLLGWRRMASGNARSWDEIHAAIQTHSACVVPSDEEHLDHRILITFPVWLKHRIAREMLNLVLKDRGLSKTAETVLTGVASGHPELARQAWAAVQRRQAAIGNRLEWAINSNKSVDSVALVDPINPLDLVSRITRVRRNSLATSKLANIGAAKRQNHPSFRGRLCPVESPESEQVGLSLQLASGAKVDFDGRIQPAGELAGELGFGAGLIPFFAHNDGARNMMGAKNLRQAVPVRGRERSKIETGGEAVVARFSAPLVEMGVCPDANAADGSFALGRDLLVAYLPWYGMNFEDAVVLGQQVADKGLLDLSFTQAVRKRIKVGWIPADPPEQVVFPWSENGLAKVGTELVAGSPLASFAWEGKADVKRMMICHEGRTPSILRAIRFHRTTDWTDGVLEYELEMPIGIKPGDKLMGRHGNKGVVGVILPTDQMPSLPDSLALPEKFRGRPIDVLLNPHGVISRMNLGQLIETHLGWLLHSDQCKPEDLRNDGDTNAMLAAPFSASLDHDKIQTLLKNTGLDEYGRVHLDLPDGKKTLAPVTVGFQHIVRLRHIPEMKSQARRGGGEALYSARTGQAVRGRKQGGGQRLGEMEVWALAAHGADAVLSEMLGIKSSIEMVEPSSSQGAGESETEHTGYRRTLQDWLFALVIDLEVQGGQIRFSSLDEEKVKKYAGAWRQVTSPDGLQTAPTARFRCEQGGRKTCTFELIEGAKIAFPSTAGGKEKKSPVLCLGDFIDHLLLTPDGPLKASGSGFELPLIDLQTGHPTNPLLIELDPSGKQLKGMVCVNGAKRPARWPEGLSELPLYGQLSRGDGKNWGVPELIAEFLKTREEKRTERKAGERSKELRDRWVTDLRIACPNHPASPLAGRKPIGRSLRGNPGGLFDPLIFGAGISGWLGKTAASWGYIKLPVEVPYPLHVFLTAGKSADERQAAVREFFEKHGVKGWGLPPLQWIPVLPAHYRSPSYREGQLIADPIDRQGYAPIISTCARYAKEANTEKKAKMALQLASQVEVLFRLLVEALQDKTGLIRRDGLGRRVDRSARLVIAPNPELHWDQAGIPVTVLVELIGDLVAAWLERLGEQEKKKQKLPSFARIPWLRPKEDPQALRNARTVVQAYLKANPGFLVLLNRQPSLHRDSFQAFHPVPLPPEAGDVIQLSPLACKSFAADFDGDEMVVHVPLGPKAQEEASRLLPSRNLFSLAAEAHAKPGDPGNVLAHFDQDFVLGTYWLGAEAGTGAKEVLGPILPQDCCRDFVPAVGRMSKDDGARLLLHLASQHPDVAADCIHRWSRKAFETCSTLGVSFGYYELREIAGVSATDVAIACDCEVKQLARIKQRCLSSHVAEVTAHSSDKANDSLQRVALKALQNVLALPAKLEKAGMHFAAMALSGARGHKQVRQLIAARGLLEPGSTGFESEQQRFFFRQSLVEGLGPEEAFYAAMNARSSICDKKLGTAYAGGLTRSLVFALWPHAIVSTDCSSTESKRNPATCLNKSGFCAACYGILPSGRLAEIGFPAGLIAAQSIGERGTQLSMRSVHGSESVVNIHSIRSILGFGAKPKKSNFNFTDPADAPQFVKEMKTIDAYRHLSERHFYVLWKVLHWSPDHTLQSLIAEYDPFARLAYRNPAREVLLATLKNASFESESPFSKVLLGGFGTHTQ